jgi:hypothetical protein
MELGEIGTGLAILGASELTKDAVQRILSPTADYIGAGVLTGTKATVNFVRVLINAAGKIGRAIEQDGAIPPRLMKAVLDEAPFCDDELSAEYLGGVLAASWTGQSRDDRGVALIATIQRLSTYAIRTHYVCYRVYDILSRTARKQALGAQQGIFLRWEEFYEAMKFSDDEDAWAAFAHSVIALEREELAWLPVEGADSYFKKIAKSLSLSDGFSVGKKGMNLLQKHGGLVFAPTVLGIELFLWAHGIKKYRYDDLLLSEDFDQQFSFPNVELPAHAKVVKMNHPSRFR